MDETECLQPLMHRHQPLQPAVDPVADGIGDDYAADQIGGVVRFCQDHAQPEDYYPRPDLWFKIFFFQFLG